MSGLDLELVDRMRYRPTVHLVRIEGEAGAEHRAVYLDEGYYSFRAGTPVRVKVGDRWVAAETIGVEHAAVIVRRLPGVT